MESSDWTALGVAGAGLLGGYMSKQSQEGTNQMSSDIAAANREFQERMSSSAYQRAVVDMQKAGLNPMLASKQGGADTPPGAMATVQNPMAAGLSGAASTVQAMQGLQSINQSRANTELMQAEALKVRSETLDQKLNTAVKAALAERDASSAALNRMTRLLREEDVASAVRANRLGNDTFAADVARRKAESQLTVNDVAESEVRSKFYSDKPGEMSPYIRQFLDILRGLTSAVSATRR